MTIPARLIRTAPDTTTPDMDRLWDTARTLHPHYEHVDLRNSIDPTPYPITSPYWADCETGAAWSDLIRIEELYWRGGLYQDSDVVCFKPFDPLLTLPAFCAFEDSRYICNAILGFPPAHPALPIVLDLAIRRQSEGTWQAGVGTVTEVFKDRDDIVIFPPGMFYPVHWDAPQQDPEKVRAANPGAFCYHLYAKSWHNEIKAPHPA